MKKLDQQLSTAAWNNEDPVVISTLIEAGADVNATDKSGATVLHKAARNNSNPKVISALMKAGADFESQDNDGNTPFVCALSNSNPAIIYELLDFTESPADYLTILADMLGCDKGKVCEVKELHIANDLSGREDEYQLFYEKNDDGIRGGYRCWQCKSSFTIECDLDEQSLAVAAACTESDLWTDSVGIKTTWFDEGGGASGAVDYYDDNLRWNEDSRVFLDESLGQRWVDHCRSPLADEEGRVFYESFEFVKEASFLQSAMTLTLTDGTEVILDEDEIKPVIRLLAISCGIDLTTLPKIKERDGPPQMD